MNPYGNPAFWSIVYCIIHWKYHQNAFIRFCNVAIWYHPPTYLPKILHLHADSQHPHLHCSSDHHVPMWIPQHIFMWCCYQTHISCTHVEVYIITLHYYNNVLLATSEECFVFWVHIRHLCRADTYSYVLRNVTGIWLMVVKRLTYLN